MQFYGSEATGTVYNKVKVGLSWQIPWTKTYRCVQKLNLGECYCTRASHTVRMHFINSITESLNLLCSFPCFPIRRMKCLQLYSLLTPSSRQFCWRCMMQPAATNRKKTSPRWCSQKSMEYFFLADHFLHAPSVWLVKFLLVCIYRGKMGYHMTWLNPFSQSKG